MPAKFNILAAASIALVPVVPLLACGGSSGSTVDAHIVTHDSSGSGSGSGSGSAQCSLPATYGSPTFSQSQARWTGSSAQAPYNELDWLGALPGSNAATFVVSIFGGCGSNGSNCGGTQNATPDWPTTFGPKSNINLAMVNDAGALIATDFSGSGVPATFYVATAGTLNVTAASNGSGAGHTFSGTVSGLTFEHVNGSDFSPAADGCMSAVTSVTFTGTAMFDGKSIVITTDAPNGLHAYLAHRYQ